MSCFSAFFKDDLCNGFYHHYELMNINMSGMFLLIAIIVLLKLKVSHLYLWGLFNLTTESFLQKRGSFGKPP